MRKLRRVVGEKWIAGVCAGAAYSLGTPVWLIRLVLVILGLSYGFGIIPYILLWIFMPEWESTPADYHERAGG